MTMDRQTHSNSINGDDDDDDDDDHDDNKKSTCKIPLLRSIPDLGIYIYAPDNEDMA